MYAERREKKHSHQESECTKPEDSYNSKDPKNYLLSHDDLCLTHDRQKLRITEKPSLECIPYCGVLWRHRNKSEQARFKQEVQGQLTDLS